MRASRTCKLIATTLSAAVVLSLGAPLAARAQDNQSLPLDVGELPIEEFVEHVDVPVDAVELPAEIERPEAVDLEDVDADEVPPGAEPTALPSGESKTAVTPSQISLPNAEGSIEGMGESFAPVLSSGTATFSVPISLPAGRAGVQPSLGLSYASTNGNSCVGFGWSLSTPFIVRQSDRGLPRYVDAPGWTPEEDQFFYNGGQELIPVDNDEIAAVDASDGLYPNAGEIPNELVGWQQYRARIEGGFMRFFRTPDLQRWVVQGKDGSRFDFGRLPVGEGPGDLDDSLALQTDPDDDTRIYRWFLTRMSDSHGSTVYYRYREDGGEHYCDDVFYLSPASCASSTTDVAAQRACTAPLANYGVRVNLEYENRPDVFSRHVSGWRIETRLRVNRITITAAEANVGERFGVRRYHLGYDPTTYHSLLGSVQVEGREDVAVGSGLAEYRRFVRTPESELGSAIVGRPLPPMTFEYTQAPVGPILGFGGVSSVVRSVANSPNVSVDAARADLFDVNTDGLPDLIVTDPARYRGPDGEPAVGVFFNGFVGPGADPAGETAIFSEPVSIPMPPSLSGVLNLASLNVLPMDADGDGRSDLLHLPRRDRYGIFTPTRMSDAAAGDSVSPADQGWRFTYREIRPTADDPRIDLTSFGEFYRTWDVNGDHLVDIVRTTGNRMQTWLNLGWVPDGDGKFGQASWDGSEWVLSSDPYETCLPHSGLPLDFADSETRTADMNGDGLVDIVRMRRGRIVWWPSRGVADNGTPIYGEGPIDCAPGFAPSRHVEVESPPEDLNPELAGVFLSDVNGDGAADVVQVRFNQIDVWFNRGGVSFTDRVTVDSALAPDFAPRIRFTDIDGTATTDLVYGNATRWEYLDFMEGTRPRLLRVVRNGLGASTTLTYGSSAEDYVADLEDGSFTWSQVDGECDNLLSSPTATTSIADQRSGACVFRSGGSPVVSTVVRSVAKSDHFDLLGREQNVIRTRFTYHDGYYEGIEQEFRGYAAADAEEVGDEDHPAVLTRTLFHQGRRPSAIATDRLADSPGEPLKGRQFLREVFDREGTFLSTSSSTMRVRRLLTGLDGQTVWHVFVAQTDELRYDTTDRRTSSSATLTLPAVVYESVDGSDVPFASNWSTNVPIRVDEYAHMRTTTDDVDNLGHVRQHTALGRVFDWEDPRVDYEESIITVTAPTLVNGSGWIWRTAHSFTSGHGTATQLGRVDNLHDMRTGDLTVATQAAMVESLLDYEFAGDAFGADGLSIAAAYSESHPELGSAQLLDSSTRYDAWGNPIVTCGGAELDTDGDAGCLRYTTISYDLAYAQLPEGETIAIDGVRDGDACDSGSAVFCTLTTTAEWDRGFGMLLNATDPNSETSTVDYDGLGRLAAVILPTLPADCSSRPAHVLNYDLVPEGQPINIVHSTALAGCGEDPTDTIQTRSYIDGLGRTRARLSRTEFDEGSGRRWEQSDVVGFTARGTTSSTFNSAWVFSDPPLVLDAVALPHVPEARASYDAFGRVSVTRERDDSVSSIEYGALSTIVRDALDMGIHGRSRVPENVGLFVGTATVSRVDGHGRSIDEALHQRDPGVAGETFYRLFTRYRADNSVLRVVRAETASNAATDRAPVSGHLLTRTFTYDSLARRIATTDPDSEDALGAPERSNWRYLFNRVDDLVAVRDARGCGQNFYYDRAGRLIAEDYVLCEEAQLPGDAADETLPPDAIALEATTAGVGQLVDCRYYFDSRPAWVATFPSPPDDQHLRGRMTAASDRGQRSLVDYDERGRSTWSARQMSLLPEPGDVALVRTGEILDVDVDDQPVTLNTRVFDEAHTYVSSTEYDRIDRPIAETWPEDPDFDPSGFAPALRGVLAYNTRGLPQRSQLLIDSTAIDIVASTSYDENRLVVASTFGPTGVAQQIAYDDRLRPVQMSWRRPPTPGAEPLTLGAVEVVSDQRLEWDAVDNLVSVADHSDADQWPSEQRPWAQFITHDALYRVVNVFHRFRDGGDFGNLDNPASDWRDAQALQIAADPMQRRPAPMVPDLPEQRVVDLSYQHDWLANMVEWTDDSGAFYERSIGALDQVVNGFDEGARPTALYLATNLRRSGDDLDAALDRGGWLRLRYGRGGNVQTMTVRASCVDRVPAACFDNTALPIDAREAHLSSVCRCSSEQHYEYRWDELNRIVEARRYDRSGSGDWSLQVRQRYRYDGANARTAKQTLDGFASGIQERVTLYVLPGDFERRGLTTNPITMEYDASSATETQYLVSGARVVWTSDSSGMEFQRDARVTLPLTTLIQSTVGVVDLPSGELLEVATYYPNGARETLRSNEEAQRFQLEPRGFTSKEDDSEVGLTYFGERYLLAHLGRWASPDPLQVHRGGGGEFGNSYHYVSGSALQQRDPVGLDVEVNATTDSSGNLDVTFSGTYVVAAKEGLDDWFTGGLSREELEQLGLRSMTQQAEWWNNRVFQVSLSGGRTATVRFDFDVRLANSAERAIVESAVTVQNVQQAPETPSQYGASLSNAFRRRGPGMNIVLAGAAPGGDTGLSGGSAGLGNVVRMSIQGMWDDLGGMLTGAHEIGHTMGLQDRHHAGAAPFWHTNLMGNFRHGLRERPIGPTLTAARPPTQDGVALRPRSWRQARPTRKAPIGLAVRQVLFMLVAAARANQRGGRGRYDERGGGMTAAEYRVTSWR